MELITVILTCYKQGKYIEDAIYSVINQTYNNRELLIWDDSPDNNCRNIIEKYVKKYPNKIHAWHHNPNKWIVNNMLFLMEQRNKKSEYIAFLEWDDCMFPEYLEKKISVFKENPDVQLVYNELTTIDSEWNIINEKHLQKYAKSFLKEWKIGYKKLIGEVVYVSWSTLMIKAKIIEKYWIVPPFSWEKTLISDMYFFNQIANNEHVFWIEDPLVYYRIHGNNTSRNILNSMCFHLDLIKYLDYLNSEWLIDYNTYTIQWCRWYLVIWILSVKKAFTFGMLKIIRVFFEELYNSISRRIDWWA